MGSVISIIGVFFFLYLIYDAYVKKVLFRGWGYNGGTLEWVLGSPPEWHTYLEAPFVFKRCLR